MSANDDANCQMPSVGIKPWSYSQKLGLLHQNQKPNTSARKIWVFSTLEK
jgi:hypothetical protein